jgi:hypothetical protein
MDWNLAIERNREALKRIVAGLVAMAGFVSFTSPLAGEDASPRRGEAEALAEAVKGCFPPTPTLPRHLHRAILRLLRPAESAVRRLVIVMARGLVVALPAPRLRKAKPGPTILCNGVGTGILMPPGSRASGIRGGGPIARPPSLPLLDPLKRPFRTRWPVANGVPRISFPGVTAPSPVALRRPPASDDLLDATRVVLRLRALGVALDDLPRQARRFARWRAAPAASSRCVRGARPASSPPTDVPTRCTKS